jgi:hypothetical protein
MRIPVIVSFVLASAASAFAAQSSSAPPSPGTSSLSPTAVAKPVDRTQSPFRCLADYDASTDSFTLSERTGGPADHLIGTDVHAYLGGRVRIVAGLVPSPTIAAQASAIDPAIAAMAADRWSTGGTGNVQALEFRVAHVRKVTGSCIPRSLP